MYGTNTTQGFCNIFNSLSEALADYRLQKSLGQQVWLFSVTDDRLIVI